jgi:UV damage endonuclease UvdE
LETIRRNGVDYSYELAKKNLQDLASILRWNSQHNIYVYRMSSEIFPFATHPEYYRDYNLDQFRDMLESLGRLAIKYNQRLTFHPGQYNQLTSLNPIVVDKTIIDLDFHAKVMDYMGLDKQSIVNIHGGSKGDGQEEAMGRFRKEFVRLSKSAQDRLTLENCELCFAVQDLLPTSELLGIPIVVDYHHHNLNPGDQSLVQLTERVLRVWERRGIVPLFHVSESRTGVKPTDSITVRRAHSDYVKVLPDALMELSKSTRIDVDIEAKAKERAVFMLYEKYKLQK